MPKIAVFKIFHCCLCPQNEMRLEKDCEFWCKLEGKRLDNIEYANFPDWCPKLEAEKMINEDEIMDLEEFLRDRCLDAKSTNDRSLE